jgi:L-fuconolactonase
MMAKMYHKKLGNYLPVGSASRRLLSATIGSMIRLDAHQHFWKYSPRQYAWISDMMPELKRDHLPEDLRRLLDEQQFHGSIAVQARQSHEETIWLLNLAEQYDFIRGVVGWVDLCSSTVSEELRSLADGEKLVGVRHVVQDEPDDEFMLRPDFQRGLAGLADFDLVYDLLIYPRHLPIAAKVVRGLPQQAFVLDHIAKPPIATNQLEPWARGLRELAEFPNVACKLSGMVTEARWKQWKADDFKAYLDIVFEAFGASRLMIGSDWPVCTLSSNYSDTLAIVLDYIGQLTREEQEGILGANCARVYGILDAPR